MFKNGNQGILILGSASPRRKELLASIQLVFKVVTADIDETPLQEENPEDMVLRLAKIKALSVAQNYPKDWVLGADTTVAINNLILGKPENIDQARQMLSQLSGQTHTVFGGYSLVNISKNVQVNKVSSTRVTFCELTPEYIERYIKTKEPDDKAGAYAIQGFGATLVKDVEGSYTNVVGLDLPVVSRMLLENNVIQLS